MKLDLTQLISADAKAHNALTARIAAAGQRINTAIDAFVVTRSGDVPLTEMLGWADKDSAARALVAGVATPGQTDLLTTEATETGESCADLAQLIVTRADGFKALTASLSGLRRKAMTDMKSATTVAEVDRILADTLASLDPAATD